MKQTKDETTKWSATMSNMEDYRYGRFADTSERWLEFMLGMSAQSPTMNLRFKGLGYVDEGVERRVESQKSSSNFADELERESLLEDETTPWPALTSGLEVMPDVSASSMSMQLPRMDVKMRKRLESSSNSECYVLLKEDKPTPGSEKNMNENVREQVYVHKNKEGGEVSPKSSTLADESLKTSQIVDVRAASDLEEKLPSRFPEICATFVSTYSSSFKLKMISCTSGPPTNPDHWKSPILTCQREETLSYFSTGGEETFAEPFPQAKGAIPGFQGIMDPLGTCTGSVLDPQVSVGPLGTRTGGIKNPQGTVDTCTRDLTQVFEPDTSGTCAEGMSSTQITGRLLGTCQVINPRYPTFKEEAELIALTMMGKKLYQEKEKTGSPVLPLLLTSLQDLEFNSLEFNSGIVEREAARWVYKYMRDNRKKIAVHPQHVKDIPSLWRRQHPDEVYPSNQDMEIIASDKGMNKRQVQILFDNDRRRASKNDPAVAEKLKKRFAPAITKILRDYQSQNPNKTQADPESRKRLLQETGLNHKQLSDWFNNNKKGRNRSSKKPRV